MLLRLSDPTSHQRLWRALRRRVLAWLLLQAQRAEQAGDADTAARLQRRIQLVGQGGTLP